jgi:hypothetical protein
MFNPQAIIGALGAAKPITKRADWAPFLGDGKHRLAVLEYRGFYSPKRGNSIEAVFCVVESTAHASGDLVKVFWAPQKPPAFKGDTGELDRTVDFAAKLFGVDLPTAQQSIAHMLMHENAAPARGMLIDATVEYIQRTNKSGKAVAYHETTWTTVDGQTKETIAATRSSLDAIAEDYRARAAKAAAQVAAATPAAPAWAVGAPAAAPAPAASPFAGLPFLAGR